MSVSGFAVMVKVAMVFVSVRLMVRGLNNSQNEEEDLQGGTKV